MFRDRYIGRGFGLTIILLLAAAVVYSPLDAMLGSSLPSTGSLPVSAVAVNWPYKGMTYVSWTRGDYPWTTSWQAQTYVNSQAISQVTITTTDPYEGQGSLALTVDLIGGDANKSNGETFVDLRYHPP